MAKERLGPEPLFDPLQPEDIATKSSMPNYREALNQTQEALHDQFSGRHGVIALNLALIAGIAARSAPVDNITRFDSAEPILKQPLQLLNVAILEQLAHDEPNESTFKRLRGQLFGQQRTGEHYARQLSAFARAKYALFVEGVRPSFDIKRLMAFDRYVKVASFMVYRSVAFEWFTEGLHTDLGLINQELAWRYTNMGSSAAHERLRHGAAETPATMLEDYAILASETPGAVASIKQQIVASPNNRDEPRGLVYGSFSKWMEAEHEWLDERIQHAHGMALVSFLAQTAFEDGQTKNTSVV